jgi:aryl-alcohol dehydrogenase-like predicted oxidoreductase
MYSSDLESEMKTTTLGRTGLHVSRVAFGTWQLGGDWRRFDEGPAIRHARECGVNFFETAQAYGFGASEQILGRALRDELRSERDELVIATKGGLRQVDSDLVRGESPEWLRHGVDLYQVRWPDPTLPAAGMAGALRDLIADVKTMAHATPVAGPSPEGM